MKLTVPFARWFKAPAGIEIDLAKMVGDYRARGVPVSRYPGADLPALGWVQEIRAEGDGYVADVELTDAATARLLAQAHQGPVSIGVAPSTMRKAPFELLDVCFDHDVLAHEPALKGPHDPR